MSISDIEELKTAWVAAVKRAVRAGFDVRPLLSLNIAPRILKMI